MPPEAGPDAGRVDDSDEIPCEPRAVLETVCQQCHAFPPVRGAPFPLVTRTDILTARPGGIARDLMISQLQAQRMPLAPVTIEDEQRATLLAWLQNGAPAVTAQSCAAATADAATDADADAGTSDADADTPDAAGDAADAATD